MQLPVVTAHLSGETVHRQTDDRNRQHLLSPRPLERPGRHLREDDRGHVCQSLRPTHPGIGPRNTLVVGDITVPPGRSHKHWLIFNTPTTLNMTSLLPYVFQV